MSRLVDLANEYVGVQKQISDLNEKLNEYVSLQKQISDLNEKLNSIKAEMAKDLSIPEAVKAPVTAPVPEATERRPRASSKVSMKSLVQSILAEHPEGLELHAIVVIVQKKIEAGEYSSNASNMSAIVAQATNALKAEKILDHNKTNRLYTLKNSAA